MLLRHKLLLVLSGLAVLALVSAVAVAWGEVRQAASAAVDERLSRVTEQLVALVARSTSDRREVQEQVSHRPPLRAALDDETVDSSAVIEALAELRSPADSGLAVRLVDRDGHPLFSDLPDTTSVLLPPPPLDTFPTWGRLWSVDDEVHVWNTAPIRGDGGGILGWIVQERRIGNPRTAEQIQDLIGSDAHIIFAMPGADLAVTLAGEAIIPSPAPQPPVDTLFSFERNGTSYLARTGVVAGSPWQVVAEIPAEAAGKRPAAFLRRMSVLGLLLVLATVLLAYAMGRRISGPIEELVEGTEALARGEYHGEVQTSRGGDELDRLARSFNEMAARVAASRAQLEERLEQERALARDLEEASARAESARLEAEQANQAKSDFLATMSHEVRTPINAILGYCDLMDVGVAGTLTDGQREQVERIRRSSRILGSLVEDVLDFARLDSGRLRLETTTARVRDGVLAATAVLDPHATREGLTIGMEVPADLYYRGDPRRLEQILMNLMGNAIKFTAEGGVTVRAMPANGNVPSTAPGAKRYDRWVRIDVQDTGPGIAEEHQRRVFEPFVQAEAGFTRRHGGTGLGLSISRELARMMGGDVTLQSRTGEGACFSVWLPGSDEPPTDEAESDRAASAA